MKFGETANAEARPFGLPLEGVKILAVEQLQAMPVATLILRRMGAEVVKVEPPGTGESGRLSLPGMKNKAGKMDGATYLRYGLGKKSIAIDLKNPEGRDTFIELTKHFDVVCENLGKDRANKLGIGYDVLAKANPKIIFLSISGFGNEGGSPYADYPAFAGVAESMSGVYEYARLPNAPPQINPTGGVGDTGTGMFGAIGILGALHHRNRTGLGQYIDLSMLDTMLFMCDHVTNYWSMGLRKVPDAPMALPMIANGFRAKDGWFMVQIVRKQMFDRLANILGKPEWITDERFQTSFGWGKNIETEIRPAVEAWAASRTKHEAAAAMCEAGIASAPCSTAEDVVNDEHVRKRHMLVEIPRTDGGEQPVLIAGNPLKMSRVVDGEEAGYATIGEQTDELLRETLGLDAARIAALRKSGAVA